MIIQDSLSSDQTKLNNARQFLTSISEQNYSWLLQALVTILSSVGLEPTIRQQAGLQAKLLLQNHDKFSAQDYNVQMSISDNLLRILGTETWRPSTVGVCLQSLFESCMTSEWSQSHLIPALVHNVSSNIATVHSIETLGYLCATQDQKNVIEDNIDQILTGVMFCVTQDDPVIRTTALSALLECVPCATVNIARQSERDYIMQHVCQCTQDTCDQVTCLALECLNKIVTCFFPLMEDYLVPALIPISMQALQSDKERQVMLGVEFWCNICDLEESVAVEDNYLQELFTRNPDTLTTLLNSLLKLIIKHSDTEYDLDTWCVTSAGLQCLCLMSRCFSTPVHHHITNFIQFNISSDNISVMFTAVTSISSLLSMEDQQSLSAVIASFLSLAENLLISNSPDKIQYAASYVINQISEVAVDVIRADDNFFRTYLQLCLSCLHSKDTKVIENSCYSLGNVFRNQNRVSSNEEMFIKILSQLLSLSDSASLNNVLNQSVSSCLIDLIENCPQNLQKYLGKIIQCNPSNSPFQYVI